MEMLEEEEEIPVKYRLRGETDWQFKKEAIMKIGRTEWAIRLKLCKQGDDHQYYSLHVALLTPNRQSRVQIKCTREGETNPEWMQEYTFGGMQTLLVNPCLMKIVEPKDKVTFVVELKQLTEEDAPKLTLPKEILFPNGTHALKVGDRKLILDPEYLKRRAPLLGYLFEDDEKKEYTFNSVLFEDLVDAMGVFHHRWDLEADRLLQLIPIARKLGFDIWGPSLNREFSQLVHRSEPVKIVQLPTDEEIPWEFDTNILWMLKDIKSLGSSSIPQKQNSMMTWEDDHRNCLMFAYTQEFLGEKYLSIGFQFTRESCSSDDDEEEEEQELRPPSICRSVTHFDIFIHIRDEYGNFMYTDKILGVKDDDYVIVGSPVFAKFEDVLKHSVDGNLDLELIFVSRSVDPGEDPEQEEGNDENRDIKMPGLTNGKIQCEGRITHINKEYLSHHSEFFRGMFSKRFVEGSQSCINLSMETLGTLKTGLDMLYNRRLVLDDVGITRILDFADRICSKKLIDGLQTMLWGSKIINIEDKQWLAEEFMLTDLEIRCAMEQNEEVLKVTRASCKRARPADFQDDAPAAPPQPIPERVFQQINEQADEAISAR
ncbi:Protein CBG05686 [Caenorhabditis briggsae]|uniref:Protein CBG05686 n=3 Tax=Caenorhabditis briggsae TaxID=6238 RepID=A8X0G0_CAEBR|nr:Protein CBG05686 [Caenorhabditis briggsae]ULT92861.1 hypothetical protein L3Y34_010149 [Caenorhabditis briggsae]CAP26120.1 Protein CBG05686 [Caenorhabditis briggsae]